MVPENQESSHASREFPAPDGTTPQSGPIESKTRGVNLNRLLAFAAAAGLLAGVASLVVGEIILKRYQGELAPVLKLRPSAEDLARFRDARIYSATLIFTAMGGFLGGMMGLAGGLARRSASAAVTAAILGLLLGTVVVASEAVAIVPIFFKQHDPQSGDLVLPLLTHGAIWSVVGAIGGLALGIGLGGRGRWMATLMGGLAGGMTATIVFELVGALAFASDKTDLPVSSSITTRAIAQVLVAILSAVGAVLALRSAAKAESSPPSPS
jgi:hypothetical protein